MGAQHSLPQTPQAIPAITPDPKNPRTCCFCSTIEKFETRPQLFRAGGDVWSEPVIHSKNFGHANIKGLQVCNACVAIMDEAGKKREKKLKAAEGGSTEKKWKVLFGD